MTGIRYDWGVWNENNYFYLFLFFYVPSRYRILHPHYGNNELVILCDLDLGVVNLFCLHALARFHFNVIICDSVDCFLVISFLVLSPLFWLQILKHPDLRFLLRPSFELVRAWLGNT